MMIRIDKFIVLMAILTGTGCGGSQVTAEFDSPQTVDQADTPEEGARPKPPPVRKEAKQLFKEAMQAYRPKAGPPKLERAIELLKDAVDEDPAFGAAYFNIGRIYEDKGDLKKAADYYQQASSKGKNFGDGLANYGRLLLIQGKPDLAREQFDEALRIDEYNSEALLNLAQDDRVRRDFQSARKRIRKALKGNEKNPKAYAVLARVYFDMGRYDLVKLVCITGLKIDDSYADLNNTLGLVHLKQDDVRSALQAFTAAVKAEPNYSPSRLNLGAIAFNYRDYETSLRHFDVVVKREPKNLIAILSRAAALRGLERFDQAESGYRSVLKVQPNHSGAHFNLGVLYQEYLSKPEQALKEFEAVLSSDERSASLRQDVTNRIKAIRIEIQNKKEIEAMMKQQKQQEAEKKPAK
ncbi:MAG: tetratricopeptide repeat protein [Bradymonadia bacterium]